MVIYIRMKCYLRTIYILPVSTIYTIIRLLLLGLCRVDAFLGNDHGRCASKLLSAYTEGDVEEIKRLAQSSAVSHLDHMVMHMLASLPLLV